MTMKIILNFISGNVIYVELIKNYCKSHKFINNIPQYLWQTRIIKIKTIIFLQLEKIGKLVLSNKNFY